MVISEDPTKSEPDITRPTGPQRDDSFWLVANKRLTRPVGLLLFVGGILMEIIHDLGMVERKDGAGVIIFVGALLIFISVAHERYREWRTDPYKGVSR